MITLCCPCQHISYHEDIICGRKTQGLHMTALSSRCTNIVSVAPSCNPECVVRWWIILCESSPWCYSYGTAQLLCHRLHKGAYEREAVVFVPKWGGMAEENLFHQRCQTLTTDLTGYLQAYCNLCHPCCHRHCIYTIMAALHQSPTAILSWATLQHSTAVSASGTANGEAV